MRARLLFIIVAILLVAGFAAQNWPEFQRTAPLNFGVVVSNAPLGVILLGVLLVSLLVFLISSAVQESRHLMEHRRHAKSLEAQRDLADKAEASRFTDLRQHIDTHLRESRQREAIGRDGIRKSDGAKPARTAHPARTDEPHAGHAAGRTGEPPRCTAAAPACGGGPRPAAGRVSPRWTSRSDVA